MIYVCIQLEKNEAKSYQLWSKYFKVDSKVFKQKYYSFDYMISTDGSQYQSNY